MPPRVLPKTYQFSQSDLWFVGTARTVSLGCQNCIDLPFCGGLRVEAPVFDCQSFCTCTKPIRCDTVCRRNPTNFVRRLREVRGFELTNVPRVRAPRVSLTLPQTVPVLYNGSSRNGLLEADAVALPLFSLFDNGSGKLKFTSKQMLANEYAFSPKAKVIATGTAKDRRLEAWWKLGTREKAIQDLRNIGVELVTSPNYSLFSDVPRWDNLFNAKRIAMTWAEFQQAGIVAALHVNARTESDYERWTHFIGEREEVRAIAFEFGTGAGSPNRVGWHVEKLCELSRRVGRPLSLVLRGGQAHLKILFAYFDAVVYLDTDSFLKTHHRQRAELAQEIEVRWGASPTPQGVPLDELFDHNVRAVAESIRRRVGTNKASDLRFGAANSEYRPAQTHH